VTGTVVLHMLPLSVYRADAINSPDGLLCLADIATALTVANTRYRDLDEPIVALELDSGELHDGLRWETPDRAVIASGSLNGEAIVGVRYARRDVSGRFLDLCRRCPAAEELDLLPHPEGGWYRRTWTSPISTTTPAGPRPTATAIYFLLTPGETSQWHSVASDELWLWHRGTPLLLEMGGRGERPEAVTSLPLGPHQPQALVPANTWQRAVAAPTAETLVSCVVSPGFDFADFQALTPSVE
jgi:predicted cupin superfamily sugar epimerase